MDKTLKKYVKKSNLLMRELPTGSSRIMNYGNILVYKYRFRNIG